MPTHPTGAPSARPLRTISAQVSIAALVIGGGFAHPSSAQADAASPDSRTFQAVADTYLSHVEPSSPHGDWNRAYAMQGHENRTYLKFDTKGVVPEGQEVASMTLRVFVNQNLRPSGLRVYVAPSNWSEARLTSDNAPVHWNALVNHSVSAEAGRWVDIPLSPRAAMDPDGPSSFELRNVLSNSSMEIATKEAGKAPQLTMTFRPAAGLSDNSLTGSTPPEPSTTAASTIPLSAEATNIPTPSSPTTAATPTIKAAVTNQVGNRSFDVSEQNPEGRKVFAHYFTPYPISIDNKPAATDYYSVHYLNPNGENGKFAASGGLLRDRPLPRDPIAGDFLSADLRTEVRQAKQSGIDGFTLNLLDTDGSNWKRAEGLLQAADAEGGFSIVPMPDMTTVGHLSPDQMADLVKKVADHPSAHRLADGRLMLSPFYADLKNTDYWRATISILETRGIKVAFVPTFVDWPSDAEGFARFSYGFSMWGGRSPANVHDVYGPRTRALGLKWMQPVAVQDQRPTAGIYDEAMNLATLRKSWQLAIDQKADFVQLTTWNDYSEGSTFAPSAEHGWAFLDASAYYLSQFKSGTAPRISRDSVVITHRKQPVSALPSTPQSVLMRLRDNSAPAVDQVEVMAFLTEPGEVTATSGGLTRTWSAPAGVSVFTLPLQSGEVSASVRRGETQTTSVTSDDVVTSSPTVQDLQYVAKSSLR